MRVDESVLFSALSRNKEIFFREMIMILNQFDYV